MTTPQQLTRGQQHVEELCAATIRALTGDPALHFRGHRLHRGARPIPVHAPHLRVDSAHDDLPACRGAADGAALRLRFSDHDVHRRLCPADPVERLIFELLEQLRVESLVAPDMPGMVSNLHRRFEDWSRAFDRSGLTESALGILLYTVAQICWSRLNAKPVGRDTEDLIEVTRASIVQVLGPALAAIRRHRRDQIQFAPHALQIAGIVGEMMRAADLEREESAPVGQDEADSRGGFSLLLDFDDEVGEGIASAASGESKAFVDTAQRYRVFTARYDAEVNAASLVRRALLEEFRSRLDERAAAQGINVARLARQLGAIFAVPTRDGWQFGEETGLVDGRRLAQLIGSPGERRLFRLERHVPRADTVVSFLIDCSGSMKTHIESVALMVDIVVRALETVGVTTEILGFTTGAWNGGRPCREWIAAGRPRHPGRLNELCHMVFKPAERSWRRARRDIAALLKSDLFREGIDGEAVEWACTRLLARSETRRILIVISDGCPMDGATNLANDVLYLDNHLKQVVARHEQFGDVEILGVGVGLDLSPFYRRCLATDLSQGLDSRLLADLVKLLGGRRR
ncbi:MAG TPA: cobalt chelatase [Rhodocyclaceae bacterium]|nr:cobalt chelatase [Rhodocyclaceae bacterium]